MSVIEHIPGASTAAGLLGIGDKPANGAGFASARDAASTGQKAPVGARVSKAQVSGQMTAWQGFKGAESGFARNMLKGEGRHMFLGSSISNTGIGQVMASTYRSVRGFDKLSEQKKNGTIAPGAAGMQVGYIFQNFMQKVFHHTPGS